MFEHHYTQIPSEVKYKNRQKAIRLPALRENRRGGRSVFLALFDPSVRPWVDASELGFVAPMSRLREMCGTMRASCLFGTHAWNKVRVRINGGNI
jgi:hypothetical protein